MNIVFCADRGVLPGLHVAAYSLLERISPAAGTTHMTIFSDALNEPDMELLRGTLASTRKPFELQLRRVDASVFAAFPSLNGSWATYYRLFATLVMEVDRFLYVDADTLCDVDVSPLQSVSLGDTPAGWVPEAPLAFAADRRVAEQLGNSPEEPYFNAGVILVNVEAWQRQRVTERAMEYLAKNRPDFWDQSALNVALHRNATVLGEEYNCITNMRKHWPALRQPGGHTGRLLHFLDYPKPWDLLGEWTHPHYRHWQAILQETKMKDFRSWQPTPARRFPKSGKAWKGYKKALKDRLLFAGYARGWLRNVKGVVSAVPTQPAGQPAIK